MAARFTLKNSFINFIIFMLAFFFSCRNNSGVANAPGTETASLTDEDYKKYNLDKISLPAGFTIDVFAKANGARSLRVSPNATIFVGTQGTGKVYALRDENHDGKAEKIFVVAKDLNTPNGVAFKDGNLYIATISTIYRLEGIETKLENPPSPVEVYGKYPADPHHGWKFISFGPDGKLYVPVGAPCNICVSDSPYASITRMTPDGSNMEIYATGIRNTVGFDWQPGTNDLWFTDNGRDNMGDNVPNDELNSAPQGGMNFGYPYCHQGNIPDPEFGKNRDCSEFTPPVKLLGPHVAALGMRFYTGNLFPPEYKNAIFIARHGSWNRSVPIGYDVAVLKMDANGNLSDPVPFANGWLQNQKTVNGRPVDVATLEDGSLLVSDDYNGVVYRIAYHQQ